MKVLNSYEEIIFGKNIGIKWGMNMKKLKTTLIYMAAFLPALVMWKTLFRKKDTKE